MALVQSNDDYIKQVEKAAPPQVIASPTIVRMDGNKMETLKKGSNEWTCMVNATNVRRPERNGMGACLGNTREANHQDGVHLHVGG
jgi:hypothetical protein